MKGNEGKVENKMQKNVGAILHTCPQKGITLIALIITIIVMLILVGVTINVALNGGLFTTAQEAAKKTQKEAEREELMSIAIAAYNTNTGKVDNDKLKLNGKYTEEQDKTTTDKIVVKGKTGTLWQIDINSAKVEEYNNSYTFTIGEFVAMEGAEYKWGALSVPFENFWKADVSEQLKNSTIKKQVTTGEGKSEIITYNITCSNNNYTNLLGSDNPNLANASANSYALIVSETDIQLGIWNEEGTILTLENYEPYKDLAFTISMSNETNETKVTSKAYLNSNGEYYYVFYSNGEMKAINTSSGTTLYKIKYENRGEQTLTVNDLTDTYENTVYIEGVALSGTSIVGNGTFKFGGYFSQDEDGEKFICLLNNRLNDNGSWSGDWETCTLDEDAKFQL